MISEGPYGQLLVVPDISEYQRGADLAAVWDAGFRSIVLRWGDPAKNGAYRVADVAQRSALEADAMFATWLPQALSLGFQVGVYGWTRPAPQYGPAANEMTRILSNIERVADGGRVTYMFDAEVSSGDAWPEPPAATRWVEDAVKVTEDRWQREAFLYDAEWFYSGHLVPSDFLAAHLTVVAGYRNVAPDDDGFTDPATFATWAFQAPGILQRATPPQWQGTSDSALRVVGPNVCAWQFTAGALLPGIPGRADCNLFDPILHARLFGGALPVGGQTVPASQIRLGDPSNPDPAVGDIAVYVTDGIHAAHLPTAEAQAQLVAAGAISPTVTVVTADALAALFLVSDPPVYPADYSRPRTTRASFRPVPGAAPATVAVTRSQVGAAVQAALAAAQPVLATTVADAIGAQ